MDVRMKLDAWLMLNADTCLQTPVRPRVGSWRFTLTGWRSMCTTFSKALGVKSHMTYESQLRPFFGRLKQSQPTIEA